MVTGRVSVANDRRMKSGFVFKLKGGVIRDSFASKLVNRQRFGFKLENKFSFSHEMTFSNKEVEVNHSK